MSHPVAPARSTVVLAVLFTGAFVMGCAEMLVVGMLDLISSDLAVSVPAAGALVTANALGLAIGGPLLTLATTRLDRRRVLLGTVTVFVLGNLVPVLVDDYRLFVAVRVVVGAAQGLFIAAAMVTATSIVPPGRSGRAMAVVISGFAAASAVGLPAGTWLGHVVGWRGSFAAVVAVAVGVLLVASVTVPSVPTVRAGRPAGQARLALAPRVLALLGLCALVFVAIQAALTYLVPFLDEVTGVSHGAVNGVLLTYGVATTLGSSFGGRLADADASRTLVVGTIGVTAALLSLGLLGDSAVAALVAVACIGLFGMGMAPSMQHRVVSLAGAGGALAASLPASAVNVGIALGSVAGGVAIGASGLRAAVLTGAAIGALAIGGAWLTSTLRPAPPGTDGRSPAPGHAPALSAAAGSRNAVGHP